MELSLTIIKFYRFVGRSPCFVLSRFVSKPEMQIVEQIIRVRIFLKCLFIIKPIIFFEKQDQFVSYAENNIGIPAIKIAIVSLWPGDYLEFFYSPYLDSYRFSGLLPSRFLIASMFANPFLNLFHISSGI